MRSFASIAPRSAAPQNERGPGSNTRNAAHDLEQQPTPRLDWSFRDIASARTLPKLSFSSHSRPAMQRKLVTQRSRPLMLPVAQLARIAADSLRER